jgi:hypothetical protein
MALTVSEREALIERCVTAHRVVDPRGARLHAAAFYDLPEDDRLEVFEQTLKQRRIEAALQENGRSTTVLAVLRAIRGDGSAGDDGG